MCPFIIHVFSNMKNHKIELSIMYCSKEVPCVQNILKMATKNEEKSNEDLKEKSRAINKNFKRSDDPDSSHNSKAEKKEGNPIDKGYAWVILVGKYNM